ncbi:MFS transporter [Streptomyces litchfieldiae]|uniref:MFS transporter n=1 Tax=Streptomyces litchfieldiae TaxID=3075543 RepID=A0ABU2MN06_9ACTN|nr:MFS transporter [Streptomyces sp. DSM 44938]MDT0342997.1 MFS transporter [Streptomyces sp. DSM 44938]
MTETGAAAAASPPTTEPAIEETGGVLSRPYRALTLGCVSTILLIAFEAMAIGTAMPAAAEALDGVSLYAFAFSAYFTTSLLGMVVSGQWCDRRGPTGPVVAGVAAFSAGLLVSGTAQAMWAFVLGRAAQGVGGGLVIVALYVMVRRAYPERLRPAALASFSAAWVVPSMIGPVIAGTVTEQFGWRWVFLGITVLVVLPLMVMLPPLRRLGESEGAGAGGETAPGARFDGRRLRLAVAVAAGAGLLQFGGQELRWLSLIPVAAGIALLVPSARLLLPRGTFTAARGLPSVIALRALISSAYLSSQSFVPLMLVTQRGLSYTQAGLALAASGGLWALGSWTQSRPWAEPRRLALVRLGTVLIAAGVALTPLVLVDAVPVWTPALTLSVGCFGMGLVTASVGVLVLRLSPPEEAGGNVASLQVCDSLGNVVMLTTVGTLFAALGGDASAAAHEAARAAEVTVGPGAFVAVYVATTVAALFGIVVGGRLRERSPGSAAGAGAGV